MIRFKRNEWTSIGESKSNSLRIALYDRDIWKDTLHMTTKHRQTLYILLAFLILALLHLAGAITNMFLQNVMFQHVINSSGLVINITGIIIGIYDIYQGLILRKQSNIWVIFLMVGIICVWFNAYALMLWGNFPDGFSPVNIPDGIFPDGFCRRNIPDGIFAGGFLQMAFLQMAFSGNYSCFIPLPL